VKIAIFGVLLASSVAAAAPPAKTYKIDGIEGADIVDMGFDASNALYVAGDFFDGLKIGKTRLAPKNKKFVARFLARFKPDGTLDWIREVGNPKEVGRMRAIAVAPDGTTAIVGMYEVSEGPGPMRFTRLDTFVMLVGPDGKLKWEKLIEGKDREMVGDVHIAADHTVHVAGSFDGVATIGATKPASTQGRHVPSVDIFVARYEADGTHTWTATAGGPEDDGASAIAVTAGGDVIVGGDVGRAAMFGTTALVGPPADSNIANPTVPFVAAYTRDGKLKWVAEHASGESAELDALVPRPDGSFLVYSRSRRFDSAAFGETQHTWQLDATGKQLATRETEHLHARGFADGILAIAMTVQHDRLRIEHHDNTVTRVLATHAVPETAEPVAFARGSDGRVAIALKVGKIISTPMGGRLIRSSMRERDCILAIAPAVDQLAFTSAK
jgi:hypothetical protein